MSRDIIRFVYQSSQRVLHKPLDISKGGWYTFVIETKHCSNGGVRVEKGDKMDTDVVRWFTGPEAAKMLGISPQRVSQLRLLGRITGVQRGKTWFYSQETIDDHLASKKGEDL